MTSVKNMDEFNELENNPDQRIALFQTQELVMDCVLNYCGKLHELLIGNTIWCLDGKVRMEMYSIIFTLGPNQRNFKANCPHDEIFDRKSSIYEYILALAYVNDASTILKFGKELIRLERSYDPKTNQYETITYFDLFIFCKRKFKDYESTKSSISDTTDSQKGG